MGYLDVVIPPDIIYEDTSGDVMVPEGGTVKLTCRAKGYPKPHVLWRREDGREIVIKDASSAKTKGQWVYIYFVALYCIVNMKNSYSNIITVDILMKIIIT